MPYPLRYGVTEVICFYTFTVIPLFASPSGGKILVLLRKTFPFSDPLSSLTSDGNSSLNYVVDTVQKWKNPTDYVITLNYLTQMQIWYFLKLAAYISCFNFFFDVLLALQ